LRLAHGDPIGAPTATDGHHGPAPRSDAYDELAIRCICHDIGTPAAAIRLLAELAAQRDNVPLAIQKSLREILREADVITSICRDPLERVGHQPTRVHDLADDVARRARLVHHCSVTTELAPVRVPFHPVAVRRLLSNLVDNACRAAGADGEVRIKVKSTRAGAVIEVADSGPGPGAWSESFGAPGGGHAAAGLGLQIVRSIVDGCGGLIRVGPADALSGSSVVVTLPRARIGPKVTKSTSTVSESVGTDSIAG
jgi:signal transduction histidine kinase